MCGDPLKVMPGDRTWWWWCIPTNFTQVQKTFLVGTKIHVEKLKVYYITSIDFLESLKLTFQSTHNEKLHFTYHNMDVVILHQTLLCLSYSIPLIQLLQLIIFLLAHSTVYSCIACNYSNCSHTFFSAVRRVEKNLGKQMEIAHQAVVYTVLLESNLQQPSYQWMDPFHRNLLPECKSHFLFSVSSS